MMSGRELNGRFAKGNKGGPGRPRRAIETEYLAAIADIVTPEAWCSVVTRALADAEQGDARAREWLSRHLFGEKTPSVSDLAQEANREAEIDEILSGL